MRLVACFLLLLMGGIQIGVVVPSPAQHCAEAEECPGEPVDCATDCQLCVCSLDRPAVAFATVEVAGVKPLWRGLPSVGESAPPNPKPRDILHVPKSSAA